MEQAEVTLATGSPVGVGTRGSDRLEAHPPGQYRQGR